MTRRRSAPVRAPEAVLAALHTTGWSRTEDLRFDHPEMGTLAYDNAQAAWTWSAPGEEPRTLARFFAEAGELVLEAWFERLVDGEIAEIAR